MTQAFLDGLLRTANEDEHFLRHNGIRFTQVSEGRVVAELELNDVVVVVKRLTNAHQHNAGDTLSHITLCSKHLTEHF